MFESLANGNTLHNTFLYHSHQFLPEGNLKPNIYQSQINLLSNDIALTYSAVLHRERRTNHISFWPRGV